MNCIQCYIGGEGEGLHNCFADGTRRIMKWNVNEGSNACKSLLYEGDCECCISSTDIWDSSNTKRFPCLCATTRDAWRPDTVEIAEAVYDFDIACAS